MTETRKWTLGAVAVAILIVAAGWFLLIAPQRTQVADLDTQAQAQVGENSQLETQLAVLKQQNKDLPAKQAELAALETKIPDTAELPTYIREIQEIGRRSDVALTSMTPTEPATVGGLTVAPLSTTGALPPEMLAALNVDLIVTGDYFGLTKFMNELETGSRYTLVSGYTFTSETTEADAAADSADLTATINARIYLVPATPELTDTALTGAALTDPAVTDPASAAPSPAPAP